MILPGLHDASSLKDPEHSVPPLAGGGLLHCLSLDFFLVLAWQGLHDPHSLHPPFTTLSLHSPSIQLQAPSSSQSSSAQVEHLVKMKAPMVPQPARVYRTLLVDVIIAIISYRIPYTVYSYRYRKHPWVHHTSYHPYNTQYCLCRTHLQCNQILTELSDLSWSHTKLNPALTCIKY